MAKYERERERVTNLKMKVWPNIQESSREYGQIYEREREREWRI